MLNKKLNDYKDIDVLIEQYPYTLGKGRFTASAMIARNFRDRLASIISAATPVTELDFADMSEEELKWTELYIKKYIELRPIAATVLAFCDQLNSHTTEELVGSRAGLLNSRSRRLIIDTIYFAVEDYYRGELQLLTDQAFDILIRYVYNNKADFITAGLDKKLIHSITPESGFTLNLPKKSFERDVYEVMGIIVRKRERLTQKTIQQEVANGIAKTDSKKTTKNIKIANRLVAKRKFGNSSKS